MAAIVIAVPMADAKAEQRAATAGARATPVAALRKLARAAVPFAASLAANTGRCSLSTTRAAFLATVVLQAALATATAQQMPAEFIGTWAADGAACDLTRTFPAAAPDGEFPFLVVTPEGYASHETNCRLTGPAPHEPHERASRRLTFTCDGEGMTWTTHERWASWITARESGGWPLQQRQLLKDGRSFTKCAIDAGRDLR